MRGPSALLYTDRNKDRIPTTRCTTNNDASNTFVDAFEASGFREALGRLQPGFDRVDWKEELVYGSTGQTACLTRISDLHQ